ncbi:hypothetical protein KAR91_01215 [Candidatus Pacearchaeota archaeon]|nr:hypothetical protein [Candidatus Pacearchaeota archaeon]
MFNKRTGPPTIDLLFNLVLSFGVLFVLSFVLINDTTSEKSIENDNNILVTMRWKIDCDIDLWLRLPDGRKVYYSNRDEPPAHLDVDVVRWRTFQIPGSSEPYIIEDNEEIITIRSIMTGEYAVNAHLFHSEYAGEVEVEVLVQDVKHLSVIYAGTKKLSKLLQQEHFVRFTVNNLGHEDYSISDVHMNRPLFFCRR